MTAPEGRGSALAGHPAGRTGQYRRPVREVSTDQTLTPSADVKGFAVRLGVLLIALQAVFLTLLVLAQAVPDDRIVAHLVEAVEDGTYASNSAPDNMGGTSSSFTECIAIGTGLGRPELGIWERALRMPRIGNCAQGPEDLRRLQRGEPVANVEEYFRYWAGWTVVTRPVLALWGLEALRRISGALLVLSGVGAVAMVARRATSAYAIALTAPLLLASNVMATPTSSVEQALSFSVAFVAVASTAWGATRGLQGAALGAAAGAAVYSFIEFLIAPAIPWMLAATVAGAVTFARTFQLDRTARAVFVTSVVWPVAFLFTWATRWTLAVLFLGWDHTMDVVRSKVEFRLGGASGSVRDEFGASTRANLDYWLDHISTAWAVLFTVIIVVAATLIVGYRRLGQSALLLFGMLALPALFAPLFYELLRNFSQIHVTKAYSNIPVAVGVVLAAAVFTATVPRPSGASAGVDEPVGREPTPLSAASSPLPHRD